MFRFCFFCWGCYSGFGAPWSATCWHIPTDYYSYRPYCPLVYNVYIYIHTWRETLVYFRFGHYPNFPDTNIACINILYMYTAYWFSNISMHSVEISPEEAKNHVYFGDVPILPKWLNAILSGSWVVFSVFDGREYGCGAAQFLTWLNYGEIPDLV